ncbi:MAG: zf-HC2 domain-containing protein [Planctomycetota bacterium]
MKCRSVRKMLDEYVYGTISARKAGRIRAHIDKCSGCEEALAETHLVHEAVGTWTDLPLPEDGFHRLDSRLGFAPPPAVVLRPRRFRHLVLPYVAGIATAASLMLFLGNPFGGATDLTNGTQESPPAVTSDAPLVAENDGPLPGERALEEVEGPVRLMVNGEVIEVDGETWHRMNGRYGTTRTVGLDYETK